MQQYEVTDAVMSLTKAGTAQLCYKTALFFLLCLLLHTHSTLEFIAAQTDRLRVCGLISLSSQPDKCVAAKSAAEDETNVKNRQRSAAMIPANLVSCSDSLSQIGTAA